MKTYATIFTTFCLTAFSASSAFAQSFVLGAGPEKGCYQKTLYGDTGSHTAIELCTKALNTPLTKENKASTYNNRGILYMRKGDFTKARSDYERAIEIQPKLAEIYMNYGAVLIYLEDYDGAVKSLNTAINDLKPINLHQALYNRALAYDHKKAYRKAYLDLKRALELRPDWAPALQTITRYSVAPKNSG